MPPEPVPPEPPPAPPEPWGVHDVPGWAPAVIQLLSVAFSASVSGGMFAGGIWPVPTLLMRSFTS